MTNEYVDYQVTVFFLWNHLFLYSFILLLRVFAFPQNSNSLRLPLDKIVRLCPDR